MWKTFHLKHIGSVHRDPQLRKTRYLYLKNPSSITHWKCRPHSQWHNRWFQPDCVTLNDRILFGLCDTNHHWYKCQRIDTCSIWDKMAFLLTNVNSPPPPILCPIAYTLIWQWSRLAPKGLINTRTDYYSRYQWYRGYRVSYQWHWTR